MELIMNTGMPKALQGFSLFSKRAVKEKALSYGEIIEHYGRKGIDNLCFIDPSEQKILISLYFLSMSKFSKVDLLLVGDDNSSEINEHLTKLATNQITQQKFGAWAKKRLIAGCIDNINYDLEKSVSNHFSFSVDEGEDRENDRIDRARDLISATR
jgi:hypothetical protein